MSFKMLVLLVLGIGFGAVRPSCASENETPSPEQLKAAAKTLMAAGQNSESLQTILDYSRSLNAVPAIKSRTMAIYALSALAKGDTNLFNRARDSHAANFPADKAFIPIQLDACTDRCPTCGGAGFTEGANDCAACGNTRMCRKCKGTGKWQLLTTYDSRVSRRQDSKINCNQCGGTGRCPTCGGTDSTRAKCQACNGAGALFELPAVKISDASKRLLGEIIASIDAEENWANRIRSVKAETNVAVRVRLLATLKEDLKKRPEAQEIERLLLADQQRLAELKAAEREKEQSLQRELSALRALKDPANPKAAIAVLSEYLASHPDSPHKIEIQSLIDGVKAKMVRQQEHKKLAYGIGAVLIVLLGLSSLNISYIRYTVMPSAGKRRGDPPTT